MRVTKEFINFATLSTGVLLVITLFSYLGEYHFFLELLTHFRLQYLVLFLFSSLFFLINLNKRWLFLSLFGLFFNVAPVLSIYLPAEIGAVKKNNEISLLLTNVLSSNQSYTSLLDKIELKQADFIVVLELSPGWATALKAIDKTYPYQKILPRLDNFGIGLYSKYPFNDIRTEDFASNGIPSIVASIEFNKSDLNIIATHPAPPMNNLLAEEQKVHFKKIAKFVQSKRKAAAPNRSTLVVVAGDLNSTLWSPHYEELMSRADLKNTRQGWGVYPSWPDASIIGYFLQIPLDHVLVTENIDTQIFEKLDSIDSDHFPIYVELQF